MDAVESAMLQRRSHSLGGAVVIRYAAEHLERVDQLFLLDSAGLHGKATIAAVQPKTREEARPGPPVRRRRMSHNGDVVLAENQRLLGRSC